MGEIYQGDVGPGELGGWLTDRLTSAVAWVSGIPTHKEYQRSADVSAISAVEQQMLRTAHRAGDVSAPRIAGTYTVKAGDTLTAIARRYNTTVAKIAALNHITDPNRIRVGQPLVIPTERTYIPKQTTTAQPISPVAAGGAPSIPASGASPASDLISGLLKSPLVWIAAGLYFMD
jgi:hypothetical protein